MARARALSMCAPIRYTLIHILSKPARRSCVHRVLENKTKNTFRGILFFYFLLFFVFLFFIGFFRVSLSMLLCVCFVVSRRLSFHLLSLRAARERIRPHALFRGRNTRRCRRLVFPHEDARYSLVARLRFQMLVTIAEVIFFC